LVTFIPSNLAHLSIVFLDRDGEPDQGLEVESVKAEKVDEHEQGLLDLLHVIHVQSVEREPVVEGQRSN